MESDFNYNNIPNGYYDNIFHLDKGIRGFWHWSKFETVKKMITSSDANASSDASTSQKKILDIGCFSGTFLGTLPQNKFPTQIGVDILEDQINFANSKYKTNFRNFIQISDLGNILSSEYNNFFDVVTVIEVIEHLNSSEILDLLNGICRVLKKDGELLITTPNYFSFWPFLEFYLNKFSDISYEEQHITKFTFFNFERKISSIMNEFFNLFDIEIKTTSHLLAPFVAGFNYSLAQKIASAIDVKYWKIFLGPLLVLKCRYKNQPL
ncbi:MAG: class I SAM-dependent methyltransferase [Oligoflexia bacterium]|nr:class I SAM-dependent methyltransferase [Oligoflexia bacterium]